MFTKPLLTSLMGGTGALALLMTQDPDAKQIEETAPPPASTSEVSAPEMEPAATAPEIDERAPDPLHPPIGLSWGDRSQTLLDWANKHDLQPRVTADGGPDDLLKVEITAEDGSTLPGHEATSFEAYFAGDRLFDATLTYRFPDRAPSFTEHRFDELKKTLSKQHGAFLSTGTHVEETHQSVSEHRLFQCEPAHQRMLELSITESLDTETGETKTQFRAHYRHGGITGARPAPKRRTTRADDTLASL